MQFMQFDRNLAIKAGSSQRLETHQFYPAKITQAYAGISQSGAKFVSLSFVDKDGLTADEIAVYYENAHGDKLSGANLLHAIMAFNNIPVLNQIQGSYKSYDFAQGGVVDKQGLIVPELVGAMVGIILSENWYTNQKGEAKYTSQLSYVCHHASQQTAKQLLSNTPAVQGQIEQAINYAEQISHKSKAKTTVQPPVSYGAKDDDIPF